MAKSKKALPEISVNAQTHPDLVKKAEVALDLRNQIADLTVKETAAKKALAEGASAVRLQEQGKDNYIGLVKVSDQGQSTAQVQFKVCSGALPLEEGQTLDAHFGSARPMLFEKDMVVTGFTDPDALLADMKSKGQNPWDLLELKVKTGVDRAFATSPHVTKDEAFLPVEGFLATLNEIQHTLTPAAKAYLAEYLAKVLKTTVNLGNK
jgi:hypothetical protein